MPLAATLPRTPKRGRKFLIARTSFEVFLERFSFRQCFRGYLHRPGRRRAWRIWSNLEPFEPFGVHLRRRSTLRAEVVKVIRATVKPYLTVPTLTTPGACNPFMNTPVYFADHALHLRRHCNTGGRARKQPRARMPWNVHGRPCDRLPWRRHCARPRRPGARAQGGLAPGPKHVRNSAEIVPD